MRENGKGNSFSNGPNGESGPGKWFRSAQAIRLKEMTVTCWDVMA